MSREIDLSKPLSDEDRAYLVDRDRWRDLAVADGHEDIARAMREAVEANDVRQGRRPPTVFGEQALVQQANAETPPPPPGEEEDLPYDQWTFDELKAELDVRKADALADGMGEDEAKTLYSKGGGQKDLIARLEADDARVTAQQ